MLCSLLRVPRFDGFAGDARVRTERSVLEDKDRQREIPISVWTPAEDGRFPAVLLSHGMGETGDSYEWLGRSLASHRFWVIAPTHRGSDRLVLQDEGVSGIIKATRRPETWQNRFHDVSFILDSIFGGHGVPLAEHARDGGVAVIGHSAGALTACALGGLQLGSVNFGDARVKAVISMSMPRLTAVIAAESWATISVPALHMTGTLDLSPQYWTLPRHRRIPFDNAAKRGDQFLITLRGATHSTYSVAAVNRESPSRRLQECAAALSTLFLKGWLLNDEEARVRFEQVQCDGIRLEKR